MRIEKKYGYTVTIQLIKRSAWNLEEKNCSIVHDVTRSKSEIIFLIFIFFIQIC